MLVLFSAACTAHADDGPMGSIKIISPQSEMTQADQDMAVARQLMAQGAYLSAVDYVEALLEKYPNDRRVTDMLITCYFELKAYDKAETFLNGQIEKNPTNLTYYVDLINLYNNIGNDSALAGIVDKAIGLFPGNQGIYNTLIRVLMNDNSEDVAMKLIERARNELGQDDLFGFDAASVYETRMDYDSAVFEYLRAGQKDSVSAATAEKKLALLIRYPGAAPKAIGALAGYLDSLPNNLVALRALLEAYVYNEQYPEAFNVCIKLDSLSDEHGHELFAYMRRCRERKLYAQVIATGDYMEKNNIENSSSSQAKFYYAEALAALGHIDKALAQYHELAIHKELRRDRAQALLALGDLYRNTLNNFDSARVYYNLVNQENQIGQYNNPAGLALAQMLIIDGDLDRAEAAYKKMMDKRLVPDDAENVSYTLALITFFRKNYADAEFGMRKHIEDYPKGFHVNDALMHSLIIGENAINSPGALNLYSEAEFYQTRRMPDSMAACLEAIRELPYSALYGLSTLKLAEDKVQSGDTTGAIGIVDDMAGQHEDDYFYPYCLKLKADLLAASPENKEAAVRIYNTLLSDYAAYPFIGEVRRSLQLLDGYIRPKDQT